MIVLSSYLCCCVLLSVFFFFFTQKTAYEVRISDWSSDVCSSDLGGDVGDVPVAALADRLDRRARGADQHPDLPVGDLGVVADDPRNAVGLVLALGHGGVARPLGATHLLGAFRHLELVIGNGDRRSVVEGMRVSVRVDLGGRRSINN